MMIRFELRKVLRRTSAKIALVIYALLIAAGCFFAISSVEWTDAQGRQQSGHAAVEQLRQTRKQWAGQLDQQRLEAVIQENQRIAQTPQAQSEDIQQKNIAFSWKQGFNDILWLLNYSYAQDFQSLDSYTANSVTVDMLPQFYSNRIKLLRRWLEDETSGADQFSDREKQFLVHQYETIQIPFQYDYVEGWEQALYQSYLPIAMGVLVLTYLVSGFFSHEFRWKADSIFFSSRYGRTKATAAKIKAAFLLITVLYWVGIGVYTLIILWYLGTDGGGCPVQILHWKCMYNVTIFQAYWMAILNGYIGALFFCLVTMLVSAKTRSAVFSVTVPYLLVLMPGILENIGDGMNRVLGLLPDRLLQLSQCIFYFDVYTIGSQVFGAYELLPWLYGVLVLLLIPALYQLYRHKQIIG